MKAIEFYRSEIPNDEGYRIDEILASRDHFLEVDHLYIQWLFPLTEPSGFNPDAPILDEDQITIFKADPYLREKVLEAFNRMLKFWGFDYTYYGDLVKLKKNSNWVRKENHNFLRITRVLKCMSILGFDLEVVLFYNALIELAEESVLEISENNLAFWADAVEGK